MFAHERIHRRARPASTLCHVKFVAAAIAILMLSLAAGYKQGQHQLAQREVAAIKRAEARRELRARTRPKLRIEVCRYWSTLCAGGGYIGHSPAPGSDGILADWHLRILTDGRYPR
jgi:hypothetical protein